VTLDCGPSTNTVICHHPPSSAIVSAESAWLQVFVTIPVRLSICSAGLASSLSAFRPPSSFDHPTPAAARCPLFAVSTSPEPALSSPSLDEKLVANACPRRPAPPAPPPRQPVTRVLPRLRPQKVPTSHPQDFRSWDQLPCNPASDWAPLDVTHASALLVALVGGAFSPRFRPSNQIVVFST
jgi:hypothetical protein